MFNRVRWWWKGFILRQWRKHYTVGGHCGCCGKWLPDEIVDIHWTWGLCKNDEFACYNLHRSASASIEDSGKTLREATINRG